MLKQMNVQPDQKCWQRTYSMGMQHAPFSRGWAIGKYSSKKANQTNEPVVQNSWEFDIDTKDKK